VLTVCWRDELERMRRRLGMLLETLAGRIEGVASAIRSVSTRNHEMSV
jgi:hypothetical protein